eukprot:4498010-Alexandrium_andersonii.AAC.1
MCNRTACDRVQMRNNTSDDYSRPVQSTGLFKHHNGHRHSCVRLHGGKGRVNMRGVNMLLAMQT